MSWAWSFRWSSQARRSTAAQLRELTTVTGIASLAGAVVTREQLVDLLEPLVRELRLQVSPASE